MLLLFSVTTCLGKCCSYSLYMPFVNVYEYVCVVFSLLVFKVGFDCINS